MSFSLTKLLTLLISPLGMVVSLLLAAVFLLSAGRKRTSSFLMCISLVLLWVSSTQVVAERILSSLERLYPPVSLQEMPRADAIVLLGGVTRGRTPGNDLTDLGGGVDRIIHAARLFKAAKAPLLVLSGGNEPGYRSEAEDMADILQLMDMPADKILLESKSRNTRQNALYCRDIFRRKRIRNILLVTSASHMRRAEGIFIGTGTFVIPAPTDYQIVERPPTFFDWLPQARALEMTTRGMKEYIGYWVYLLTETMR